MYIKKRAVSERKNARERRRVFVLGEREREVESIEVSWSERWCTVWFCGSVDESGKRMIEERMREKIKERERKKE